MTITSLPVTVSLLVFIALCMAVDVRTRRIPNALSGAAVLVGAALNTWHGGTSGLVTSLAGFATAVAILFAPFALGGIGAGDVKMMGAVGAFLGPRPAAMALVAGMLLGGLVMTLHLARLGRLRTVLASTGRMVEGALRTGSLAPLRAPAADPGAITLPYSVPLGLGAVVAMALSGGGAG